MNAMTIIIIIITIISNKMANNDVRVKDMPFIQNSRTQQTVTNKCTNHQ
jgi:hypothetical protein